MGVLDIIRGQGSPVLSEAEARADHLERELGYEREMVAYLIESMADVELSLEDRGWERLGLDVTDEMSRAGLGKASKLCRVMAVANPLVKRGLNVRQSYVFGGNLEISARDEDVNVVVQKFLKDNSNKNSFSGSQSREELERALGTDGNVFLACFTTPRTGRVEVRSFPFHEISDIITNPEDRDEPWYYERKWTETAITSNGVTQTRTRKAYYPDLRYRPSPANRLRSINGHEVNWNAPIYHVSVNRLDGWKFGIGDAFAAIAWARGYKEFLEDWATLVKALSRFAWRAQGKGASRSQRIRDRIARKPAVDPNTGRPLDVGATAVMDEDAKLEAIPKSGAVIDSSSGKPLAAMVASALEISLVVLLTDPGSSGARAVAETLDEPTIRMAEKRRKLWEEAYDAVINYRIDTAVRAGDLPGVDQYDRDIRRFVAVMPDEEMRALDIVWPELGSDSVTDKVSAIVEADSTQKIPPEITARLLLQALGVKDAEDVVNKMMDDDGNFISPEIHAMMAAVMAYRRGEDPVGAL